MKLSTNDYLLANRKAEREINLVGNFYKNLVSKPHKSKKHYNRKNLKIID